MDEIKFTSIFALLTGFTQFSKTLLKTRPVLHRKLGYLYVINVLFITGPAGLIMSLYANGGIASRIGFAILSISLCFNSKYKGKRNKQSEKFSEFFKGDRVLFLLIKKGLVCKPG